MPVLGTQLIHRNSQEDIMDYLQRDNRLVLLKKDLSVF